MLHTFLHTSIYRHFDFQIRNQYETTWVTDKMFTSKTADL